ncbi:MAG TPA: helix-turn-helix domain-containing protein [Thermomicrobiales bacterium]|nr:helix-turn-helix domain-containing protein [Thermomicrobiales bacterium]
MGEGTGEPRRWLTIDAACRLLGVDHSTLRRWSDAGRINVFVTPGGHRRYAEADVRALIERARGGRHPLSGPLLTGLSLSNYGPERLSWVQAQSWYTLFDAATLRELREEGRQLVELTMRYVSSREGYAARDEILDEAVTLAGRYGERNARLGIGLGDSVTAFLFFRAPTVETVASYMETEYLPPKRAARIFRDLGEFLDRLLLAMIGAHERELTQRRARPTRQAARFTGQR